MHASEYSHEVFHTRLFYGPAGCTVIAFKGLLKSPFLGFSASLCFTKLKHLAFHGAASLLHRLGERISPDPEISSNYLSCTGRRCLVKTLLAILHSPTPFILLLHLWRSWLVFLESSFRVYSHRESQSGFRITLTLSFPLIMSRDCAFIYYVAISVIAAVFCTSFQRDETFI